MGETDDETKGFKVSDRRAFTADGEPRKQQTAPAPEKQAPRTESAPRGKVDPPGATDRGDGAPEAPGTEPGGPPEVGFMDLINMLVSNALVQLGDMPDPISGKSVENLEGVQVMIGFLAMLKNKTKGNLDKDEARVLDDVLYDLRMRFMTKSNVIKR